MHNKVCGERRTGLARLLKKAISAFVRKHNVVSRVGRSLTFARDQQLMGGTEVDTFTRAFLGELPARLAKCLGLSRPSEPI